MCGILGKLNFNRNQPVDEGLLKKMADNLKHRGPDSAGFYIKNNIGLGHRRLSIIDLSEAGKPFNFVYFKTAAVKVVLPWSTWPIVPMFKCGFVLSNLAFSAIILVIINYEL